jgi:RsiW-degrading membrane proteinase PrsW (M82 family)
MTSSHFIVSLIFAFLGGILPVIGWLFFWLKEDKKNPEPKHMIAMAFIGGMIAVAVSLKLEGIVVSLGIKTIFPWHWMTPTLHWLENFSANQGVLFPRLMLVLIFAPIIEEATKFIAAYLIALRSKEDDEPIDPVIYMITTALGFAAVENMLFLLDPILKSHMIDSILTGNMRFIGATLLHTISSATIGMFIGFNFFKNKFSKFFWTVLGFILAVVLHSMFNFFIISNRGNSTFTALESIWIIVIIILLLFEKIKKVKVS